MRTHQNYKLAISMKDRFFHHKTSPQFEKKITLNTHTKNYFRKPPVLQLYEKTHHAALPFQLVRNAKHEDKNMESTFCGV